VGGRFVAKVEDFRCNGIPVFIADDRELDPTITRAVLVFRVGAHDEEYAYGRITKLAASWAHSSMPSEFRSYVSVETGGLFTSFQIEAPNDLMADVMGSLVSSFRRPDVHLYERQQQLLAADDATLGLSPAEALLFYVRFGVRGPGLRAVDGLATELTPHHVTQSWMNSRFCAQNAALVVSAPWPGMDTMSLTDGVGCGDLRVHARDLGGPTYVTAWEDDSFAFQLLLPEGPVGELAMAIVGRLIDRRLTQLQLLAPRTMLSSVHLDSKFRSLTCAVPSPVEGACDIAAAVSQTLDDLAETISPAVFQEAHSELVRERRSRSDVDRMMVDIGAFLFPSSRTTAEDLAELEAATSADVAAVISAAIPSVLGGLQVGAEIDVWRRYEPDTGSEALEGDTHRQRGVLWFRKPVSIISSDRGISYVEGDEVTTFLFADCVALIDSRNELELRSADGNSLSILPSVYSDGEKLRDRIRAGVPSDLHVHRSASLEEEKAYDQALQHANVFTGWRLVLTSLVGLYCLAQLGFGLSRLVTDELRTRQFVALGFAVFTILIVAASALSQRSALFRRALAIASTLLYYGVFLLILGGATESITLYAAWHYYDHNHNELGAAALVGLAMSPLIGALVAYFKRRHEPNVLEHCLRGALGAVAIQITVGIGIFLGVMYYSAS
jgi:hypothetical protein